MDKVALLKRITQAVELKDLKTLTELEQELQQSAEPWAGPLRMKAIQCRMVIARASSASGTSIKAWYERLGLPSPDGRELYLYRLSRSRFVELEGEVKAAACRSKFQRPHEPALFVLWAAEWFRLGFSGGVRRWSDVGDMLGIHLEQAEWRHLTDDGLRLWKVKPLALNGITHRLLTLARQGGFPIAATKGNATSWAAKYLGQLVGSILAQDVVDHDAAYALAENLAESVPLTWRSQQFFAVSGDLALAIAVIRREAEVEAIKEGLSPSLWLNLYRPDWRKTLPLETDSDVGDALIDGLMRAPVQRRTHDSIAAVRQISRAGDSWKSILSFRLDGTLAEPALADAAQNWSRLRIYATGALTRFLPGELGVVEPVDRNTWLAVASKSLPREVQVPLEIPAEIECRGDGVRIGAPIVLRGGEPQPSQMIVCQQDDPDKMRLTVIGHGSGRYRASTLFLIVPKKWSVQAGKSDETVECMTGRLSRRPTDDVSLVYRVEGGALVTASDGERYRIRTGQPQDNRDTMRVVSAPLDKMHDLESDNPIFVGLPEFRLRENAQERIPRPNDLQWRRCSGGAWKPIGSFNNAGRCEFIWRDDEGYVRNRLAAIVLPEEFSVKVSRRREDAELRLTGWPYRASVVDGVTSSAGAWLVSMRGRSSATLKLSQEGQPCIQLSVRLPRPTWIESWDGAVLNRRAKLALSELHRYVARAEGNSLLQAELRDASNKRVDQAELRISFTGDLPLNTVREDLAAILRPYGQIDACIQLYFSDTPEAYWTVAEFGAELKQDVAGLIPEPAIVDDHAEFVGRAMFKPQEEVVLALYGPTEVSQSPRLCSPAGIGVWLVYLRSGSQILTRPRAMVGADLEQVPESKLGRVSLIRDGQERHIALEELSREAEGDGQSSARIRREITALACSLNGLPPATFDVLSLLPHHPLLAARLLLEAQQNEFSELAAVMTELPFSWSLIPKRFWDDAARLRFEFILSALPENMRERGTQLVFQEIVGQQRAVASSVSLLSVQFGLTKTAESIMDAAQKFLQRAHDKAESSLPSPFRARFGANLPEWPFDERYWRALDAPCAAALTAAGRIIPAQEHIRCIKDIERRYPRYFEQAYIATTLNLEHSRD